LAYRSIKIQHQCSRAQYSTTRFIHYNPITDVKTQPILTQWSAKLLQLRRILRLQVRLSEL